MVDQPQNSNDLLCPKCQQAGRSVPVICNEGISHTIMKKSGILASTQEFINYSQVASDFMAPQKPDSAINQAIFSIITLGTLLCLLPLFYLTVIQSGYELPFYIPVGIGILSVFCSVLKMNSLAKIATRKDKNNEERYNGQMQNYNTLYYCNACHVLFDNVRKKFELAHSEGFEKMIYYSLFKK